VGETRTPAEIVGDRHNCFMTETTLSRKTKTREIYAKPHAATFAGKQKGEALRFGVMMQLSQRARKEAGAAAAARAAAGAGAGAAGAGAAGEQPDGGGDGADGAAAEASQLAHALSGKLMVSSTKKSKRRGGGAGRGGQGGQGRGGVSVSVAVDHDAKVLYAAGSHGVTLPHIHAHKRSGGASGGKKGKGKTAATAEEEVTAAE
jgi:hypothetical protein